MPEIPDLQNYLKAMESSFLDQSVDSIRVANPFVLRTVTPTTDELVGVRVDGFTRIGKRLVISLESRFWISIHLMIAGRLHWRKRQASIAARNHLLALDFASGSLVLTEAGKKRRAAVHLFSDRSELQAMDRGGLEVFEANADSFRSALSKENHTLKRALTDQRLIAGIGNAYSDEILHHARLSPLLQTKRLTDDQWTQLWESTRYVLELWIDRLHEETGGEFPEKVTAFHAAMAVHGKYKEPCPDCGHPVQRIRYATNECNYCASCQNQGNLLADRALSRLLKKDWPRTLAELEEQ
jgi:formamidopyrimidine-DNA glycosylase|tara:strand:- start:1392 stop:2282 length:891 start_codon:yes stop_codon:yes gene_type:complete